MIKAILTDDEPRGLATLEKLLAIHCPEVDIAARCQNADEAENAIRQHKPDLLFLDVSMPGRSGFDLLAQMDHYPEVIFVTAHSEYMSRAFQFSAIDYLIKPVDEDLLTEAVRRAANRIQEREKEEDFRLQTLLHNAQQPAQKMKLCIPSLKGFSVVDIEHILYCVAQTNYTTFHFSNRSPIMASRPIHDYEHMLQDNHFVRIHKSYLVNLQHIREYLRGEGGSVILTDGTEVEVSRRKKESLMDSMKNYFKM